MSAHTPVDIDVNGRLSEYLNQDTTLGRDQIVEIKGGTIGNIQKAQGGVSYTMYAPMKLNKIPPPKE